MPLTFSSLFCEVGVTVGPLIGQLKVKWVMSGGNSGSHDPQRLLQRRPQRGGPRPFVLSTALVATTCAFIQEGAVQIRGPSGGQCPCPALLGVPGCTLPAWVCPVPKKMKAGIPEHIFRGQRVLRAPVSHPL